MEKIMTVVKCVECSDDKNLMYVGFNNGLGRLFRKENFMETIKSEYFYNILDERSKTTIALGYACATGKFSLK